MLTYGAGGDGWAEYGNVGCCRGTGCGEWTLLSWSGAARLVMGVARIGWVCGAGFHWDLV